MGNALLCCETERPEDRKRKESKGANKDLKMQTPQQKDKETVNSFVQLKTEELTLGMEQEGSEDEEDMMQDEETQMESNNEATPEKQDPPKEHSSEPKPFPEETPPTVVVDLNTSNNMSKIEDPEETARLEAEAAEQEKQRLAEEAKAAAAIVAAKEAQEKADREAEEAKVAEAAALAMKEEEKKDIEPVPVVLSPKK